MSFCELGLWSAAFFIVLAGMWIASLEWEHRDIERHMRKIEELKERALTIREAMEKGGMGP